MYNTYTSKVLLHLSPMLTLLFDSAEYKLVYVSWDYNNQDNYY